MFMTSSALHDGDKRCRGGGAVGKTIFLDHTLCRVMKKQIIAMQLLRDALNDLHELTLTF